VNLIQGREELSAEVLTGRFAIERREMVLEQLRARGIRDQRVLAAMDRVPRHLFVETNDQDEAYADHPLPIGEGQTVSQPLIVAVMLEALELAGTEKVLEVGTGSGYQTALLGGLAREVYSVELLESLARIAEERLRDLGYIEVTVVVGDGSLGLPEKAPFDAIIVSAAAPDIPKALLEQLAEGGRLVVPVGPAHSQELKVVRKREGMPVVTTLGGCRFVPLIGEQGYQKGW